MSCSRCDAPDADFMDIKLNGENEDGTLKPVDIMMVCRNCFMRVQGEDADK